MSNEPYTRLAISSDYFINHTGGFWPPDKIQLQLAEEVGELIQACRKKTRKNIIEEAGDVLFVIMTFIESEDMLEEVVAARIEKNRRLLKQ